LVVVNIVVYQGLSCNVIIIIVISDGGQWYNGKTRLVELVRLYSVFHLLGNESVEMFELWIVSLLYFFLVVR
jgi:hypothetical protein